MNTLFPAFLDLDQKLCVVVGGGDVALRKIRGLLECRAVVRVISPSSIPQIVELQREKKIVLHQRSYQTEDITGAYLVVAATNHEEVNHRISEACQIQTIFCNVVDDPKSGSFYYASSHTCGDVKIAVSTNGVSPALARKIKCEVVEQYLQEFDGYVEYLRRIRAAMRTMISEESERKEILCSIVKDSSLREQCQKDPFHRQIAHLDYEREVQKWRR